AADFAPVDAAALGVARGASVGVFVGSNGYAAGGGPGIAGGALRGFVAAGVYQWSVGAGYARTLVNRQVVGVFHTTIGGELVGGYRNDAYRPRRSGALNLTVPLGLTLGDANRRLLAGPSLAIYLAPFAEAGLTHRTNYSGCVQRASCPPDFSPALAHALGVGAGTRISIGRFATEFMARNLGHPHNFRWADLAYATLGISYRLGP